MHRCLVPNATERAVDVTGDQAHHLVTVLRLGTGASVVVCDGRGREWTGRITAATKARVAIDLVDVRRPAPAPLVDVTMAVAVLKGDQMNEVIRDVTALGAGAVAPFVSAHVAVSGRANWSAARERWARVAASAAMQCGRSVVPDVREVVPFEELLEATSRGDGLTIVCVEPSASGAARASVPPQPPLRATVFVGPEGGWSPEELTRAADAGARWLGFGPLTLRAELAPTVALATLWERWAGTRR